MRKLTSAYANKAPPLNPLDVWVWEVMAAEPASEMLSQALATKTPLVGTHATPGGRGSVREAQGRVV
jgi:hypothetical protein